MDTVLRSTVVYIFLLVIFRISGKRSLSQMTTFDFILLLIISEATQQALVGNDFSIINACLVVGSLVALDMIFSWIECRSTLFSRVVGGLPLVIVENGRLLEERAKREGVTLAEVLAQGREKHGLERLDQFKYAILERHGGISVIPTEDAR